MGLGTKLSGKGFTLIELLIVIALIGIIAAIALFKVYLPGPSGVGLAEPAGGFAPGSGQVPDLAEASWCSYAWPLTYSGSGTRTFFTNQRGEIVATEDSRYSGPRSGPPADSAFESARTITGVVAVGVAGSDGNTWQPVG